MNCKLLVHEQNVRLNLTMFPEECIISRALACTFRILFGAMTWSSCILNMLRCLAFAELHALSRVRFYSPRGNEGNTNKRARNKELEDCHSPTLRGSCATSLRTWCWRRRYVPAALQSTTP